MYVKCGSAPSALRPRLELVRRAIQVERVRGAHEQMNAALEARRPLAPVRLHNVRQVVVIVPVGHHLGMNGARLVVEHRLRRAILALRRKHPIERSDLASEWTEHVFKTRELLHRGNHLALVAEYRNSRAVGALVHVGAGCVEVGTGEVVEVTGVGRCGPCAAEDVGIVNLELQCGPASAGVPVEKPAGRARIHAVLRFKVGDKLRGERRAPWSVVH